MSIHVFIRADANPRIGIGHVQRCLALAQAWQYEGVTACFVGRIESSGLKERILDEGFKFMPLHSPHFHYQEIVQIKNIIEASTRNSFKGKEPNQNADYCETVWVILDGY